jgi:hypothetical protein
MKKLFWLLWLTLGFLNLRSQDTLMPSKGYIGIGFNLTGFLANTQLKMPSDEWGNNIVFARYYLNNDKVLRLSTGINSISNKVNTSDSIASQLVKFDSTFKRTDISFAIGFEKHLRQTRRLDPYIGSELQLAFIGRSKSDAKTQVSDITGTATIQNIVQRDGGQAYGIYLFTGFNFFIADKFSIGAEGGLGYFWIITGGNVAETIINTPVSGQTTSNFTTRFDQSADRGLKTRLNFAFLLSYYF